jgi:subtilisin family serine protease
LYGTSFAAPVVSGYAAIVGSKFTRATATQISNQLLNTARQDTIANYSATLYGRGEASLSRALAPLSIK